MGWMAAFCGGAVGSERSAEWKVAARSQRIRAPDAGAVAARAAAVVARGASRGRAARSVRKACPVDQQNGQGETQLPVPTTGSADADKGEIPPPLTTGDMAGLWWTNIQQTYGSKPSVDGAPRVEGDPSDLLGDQPFFIALAKYFAQYGSVFKLAFGPKVFFVVSDPAMTRFILRDNPTYYDKGVLAEILEPIMGKGLIPADFETWKKRRRVIAPGFHMKWLDRMTRLFGECTDELLQELDRVASRGVVSSTGSVKQQLGSKAQAKQSNVIDMETAFCSCSLDIIGKAVFNYEFGSVTNESPIIKAVYRCLREAEHRSTFLFPYWKIEFLNWVIPRQRKFRRDMKIISDQLDELIQLAVDSRDESDLSALESRDYDVIKDPSMLRFLVDLRGEQATCSQLRDDLITLLTAGHETTAALLTWALCEIARNPHVLSKLREEIDTILPDRKMPTMSDVKALQYTRRVLAETLRMYPQPPVLIRRALKDHTIPAGTSKMDLKLLRGNDLFISLYTLHRHPDLWENPNRFDPDRWTREFTNPAVKDWKGYKPNPNEASLYPNEINSDYAFMPFGAGPRKCVGDQFAMLEATVCLAMTLREFDFEHVYDEVGMTTGATIHTQNGLMMRVTRRRDRSAPDARPASDATTSSSSSASVPTSAAASASASASASATAGVANVIPKKDTNRVSILAEPIEDGRTSNSGVSRRPAVS
ncbi:Cytochrome P450 97B3, chloroplastic [Porphyridium purpureum]|uniref:Cytochrome P450 97B3, chloroplastic n=1 Tax=Porphyridium purpureum TaxID=35688 RepID=A0A5J4YIC7_PORPP|nr:Cytochrome P450 97B3, chloroplastic [Porphyridium purpureum]|eukprot:POR6086..scf237_24